MTTAPTPSRTASGRRPASRSLIGSVWRTASPGSRWTASLTGSRIKGAVSVHADSSGSGGEGGPGGPPSLLCSRCRVFNVGTKTAPPLLCPAGPLFLFMGLRWPPSKICYSLPVHLYYRHTMSLCKGGCRKGGYN